MKGVLWYCRDTLISRWNWKERYFILTDDYLSCFKKAKGPYSDLGAFLFKVCIGYRNICSKLKTSIDADSKSLCFLGNFQFSGGKISVI